MGYEPKNYFNISVVSDELMAVATKYFNLALIVSAVSAGLMLITMIFYNLSKKDHKRIMEELKARVLGEISEEVVAEQAEVESVAEDVTIEASAE